MKKYWWILVVLVLVIVAWVYLGKKKTNPENEQETGKSVTEPLAPASETRVITVPRYVDVPIGVRYSVRTREVRKAYD